MLLKLFRIEMDRRNEISSFVVLHSRSDPIFFRQVAMGYRTVEIDRFHHLSDEAVGQDHYRVPVTIGNVESLFKNIDGFLDSFGSEHDEMIVSVSAAAGCLIIIGLRRLDAAESGASAHD